ncbi:hypothetical protein C0J52_04416 [Blattella germanica]|nr:hypothetical protein C0J52_04416 [Blattella germanica]
MKEKQNSGRFNIIGVSWGGILAIEVARLLEAEGHTTNVILIDGAPDIILAFSSPLNLADDSTNIGNWEKLLSKVPEEFKSRVSAAQSYFKNCIQMVADYKPSGKLFFKQTVKVHITEDKVLLESVQSAVQQSMNAALKDEENGEYGPGQF